MTSRTYRSASSSLPPLPSSPSAPAPAPPPPASFVPETCAVPRFAPLRVSGGRYGLRRAVRRRRRAVAAGLAMTAAALAASGLCGPAAEAGPPARAVAARPGPSGPSAVPGRSGAGDLVSAPVRIADGATVRLLRPGDRVDVIAAPASPAGAPAGDGGPEARIVVSGVRVAGVPRSEGESDHPDDPDGLADTGPSGGALLVLTVPRAAAADLVAASAASRLAVVLC